MTRLVALFFGLRRAALALILCVSCESRTPELIRVFDIAPSEVETHDTLTIRGAGFPPGEKATVYLDGALFRVGAEPMSGFSVSIQAYSESEERVSWVFDKELVARFTAAPELPRHTTFRGTATVTFAPNTKGAPPIRGSQDVVLDVYPSATDPETEENERRVGEFLGAELQRSPDGVVITALVPEGRLANASLQPNDRIVAFDGLRVRTPLDLLPHAGQRAAAFVVERGGARENVASVEFLVDVEGFRPQSAGKWSVGLALLAALISGLLLTNTKWGRAMGWYQARAWLRLRRAREAPAWFADVPVPRENIPRGFAAFLGVSAVFAAIRLGTFRQVGDFDLALLLFVIICMDLMTALIAGGHDAERWSLLRTFRALLSCLPVQLALTLALVSAVVEGGSLGLLALAQDQGALPWDYGAFESVSSFMVGVVLVSTALLRSLSPMPSAKGASRVAWLSNFFTTTSALLLLGVAMALFGGGWETPAFIGSPSPLLSATWFQFKLVLAYIVVLFIPRLHAGVESRHLQRSYVRSLLPLALTAAMIAPIWIADVWPDWLRSSVSLALQVATVIVVVGFCLAFLSGRKPVHTSVNPWI